MLRLLLIATLTACASKPPESTGTPAGQTPTSGATQSGTTSSTTLATGTPFTPTTTSTGTPTTTTTTGCPPPTPPPADLCDLAVANPALLDQHQPVATNEIAFCHTSSGTNFTLVQSTVASCLTHAPHTFDLFPLCRPC